jgi:hypothetical protein
MASRQKEGVMMKRHKIFWLFMALAMIFTMQVGIDAEAARFPYLSSFNIYNGSICADAILKKLGYVYDTDLEFSIFNLAVTYSNDNPAGNSGTAGGIAHVGESLVVVADVSLYPIDHNGTAEVKNLCIDDTQIYEAVESAVLPNDSWTLITWNLEAFDARFVIYEFDDPRHVVEASCVPGGLPDTWECTVYYDSQAK